MKRSVCFFLVASLWVLGLGALEVHAGYAVNKTSTTAGTDSGGASSSVLKLEVTSVSNTSNYVSFRVSKKDGTAFTTSGTIYIKLDCGTSACQTVTSGSISAGGTSKTFSIYMPTYVTAATGGKNFYGRYYTSSNGYWSYAGPIQVYAPPLDHPGSTSTTNVTTTSAQLNWGSVVGANVYRHQATSSSSFSTSADGKTCYNCVANSTTSGTNATISGLDSATTYRWRVRAGNSTTAQESPWSYDRIFATTSPTVTSVSPSTAMLDQLTTFTVYGSNLTSGMGFWIADCDVVQELSGSSSYRQFRCTPKWTTGTKSGVVKTSPSGTTLHNFSINVLTNVVVSNVTPTAAVLDQLATFTVYGSNLTSGMGFWIANCDGVQELSGSATYRQFRCTPRWQLGSQSGTVKDTPNGTTLYSFSVSVTTPLSADRIDPVQAAANTLTTFTVSGSNLTSGMGFWIANCVAVQEVAGGSSTERQFTCTPNSSLGSQAGIVKTSPNGATLRNFSVSVVTPPVVTEVKPVRTAFNTPTIYYVRGSNLPSGMGFWIAECEGVLELAGGTSSERKFRCTPQHSLGQKAGVVKVADKGTTVRSFSVDVVTLPTVTELKPTQVAFDTLTTFTVKGQSLPPEMAFWVGECDGVTELSGGTLTERQFRCTPRYTLGSKQGSLKLASDGTVLRDFSVNVVTLPTVNGVGPVRAAFGVPTIFTVSGSNLPTSMGFWISECDGVHELSGGDSAQRFFECTPSYTVGAKQGVVKVGDGGTELHSFSVEVITAPAVTAVSPLAATLDVTTTFTVTGSNLPSGLAFSIDECTGVTELAGGTSTSRQFRCTPSYSTGTKQGLVKVTETGTTLMSFNVEVASSVIYQNVSPWAQEAADYMVQNGIVEDPPNHDLRGTTEANRAEVATMVYRALGGGRSAADATFAAWHGGPLLPFFADAGDPGAWYFKPATYLGMLAYASDADGTTAFNQQPCIFRPAQSISRAWVLKALLEAWEQAPLDGVSGVPLFDDVAPSHPAAGYVYRARQLGIAEGTNNNYRPNDWTNREDLFVLLHRVLDPSVNPQAPAKPVPSADDFYRLGRCSQIGHRYEQPILRGVRPPTVDVSATTPQPEDVGLLRDVYISTLEALISGLDPNEYVDANGVSHTASAFCAWAADGGTFIDLDPGSPEPFCRVKWLAPVDFIDGSVFTVTLYVGDSLGSEVRRTVPLALPGASPDTTAPEVTMAPLPSGLVGGEPMEVTGTVADNVDAASADYGVLTVKLAYSFDGAATWIELGPAELLAGNAWRYRWLLPRLAGSVTIRAVATNLLGNHAEATRTTTIGTLLTIEGTVVDSFGQPVENARAVLSGGGLGAESLADNLGSFRFTSLGDGLVAGTSYTLAASFDGRTAARSGLVLSAASPTLFPLLTLDTSPPVTAATPGGGTYSSPQSVELACSDDRSGCLATHYTIDGTQPTTSSPVYGGLIDVSDTTLRFFSIDQSGNAEVERSETYTLEGGQPPPNTFILSVIKQGDGDGTVSGGGINCGPGCSTSSIGIEEGTPVTLTGSGDQFISFMGEICYGTEPCSFSMFRDVTVHASFALPDSLGVSFTTPANGDTGVGTSTYPTIYFNRDVQPGPTFNGIEFRLSDGSPVPFTAVIGHPDSRLTIVRDSSLTRGQTYQVVIPAGAVSDQQGTPLAAPYSFTFTVEEEGMPKMYVSVYPRHVMEGRKAKATVWFESPFNEARWLEFSSGPNGQLIHPSGITLEAGAIFVEIDIDTRLNHGSLSDFTETFQVTDVDAGTQSVQVIVVNDTSQSSNLVWQASSIVDDADGDGIFEANEWADIQFFVANLGSSTIFNVVLEFQIANTFNMSILGGSPYTCTLGAIGAGRSASCTRSFRADADLPTGDYYIKVHGTSSGADEMRQNARVHVVNNSQPDFVLIAGSFTNNELPPGSRQEVQYTARNSGDGFSPSLPIFEVLMEIEGQEELLYRTFAEVRGDVMHEQTFRLPFTVPATPGTYPIRARINPPGAEQRPESNYGNNDAAEITLRVAAPNQPPDLGPIGGPFFVNVGSPLDFTVSATDPNGDPVTFRLGPGAPAGMTIGSQSGRITWTPACGQGSQTISVIAEDPDLAADSEIVSIVVGVQADLSVSKTASAALAVPGQVTGFTVVVTNHGPSCVSGATVSDVFVVDLVDVEWTCTASPGSSCAAVGSGNVSDGSVALLANGTATYEITARIADAAAGLILNEASASVPSGAADPNGGNNSAAVSVTLRDLDFGDAPDAGVGAEWKFPTRLADDGARHGIDPALRLGAAIDGEPDGQPGAEALGDDDTGADDESGVVFVTPMAPCESTDLEATASAAGYLDAWVDFNVDGDWNDSGEQIFVSRSLAAGVNSLSFTVPCSAVPASRSHARFRLSSVGGLSYSGLALDGEVEDYAFPILGFDFGDAPAGYPTLRAEDGPRHLLRAGSPVLGQRADAEADGLPDPDAAGDDLDGALDDEDGIVFAAPLVPGSQASVTVTVSAPAKLDAWVDFNGNGDWTDPGEQIFANKPVAAAGANPLTFAVPATAPGGVSAVARFRLSTTGGLAVTGPAADGEVEDHRVAISEIADLTLTQTDSSDPASAGATLAYTLVVTNRGPFDAPDVTVTDNLPSGVAFVATSGCVEDPNGIPTCSLGTVAAGASKQLTLTVMPDPATTGTIFNTACVAAGLPDASPGDECATEGTVIEASADLALAKNDHQDPVIPGSSLTYTLTVSNLGPSDSTGGQVTDVLPAELSFVSSADGCSVAGQTVTCAFGPLAAGTAVHLSFTVAVAPEAAVPIVNTATVTGNESDPVPENSTDAEATSLVDFPPTVTRVDTVAGTGDGELAACETARVAVTEVLVTFSEALQDPPGDTDPDDVTNPDNYLLLGAGPDQDFATDLCGTLFADDEPVALDGVTWDAATHTATLALAGGEPLPDGAYRLLVCGSTSLYDAGGNSLDGDGDGTGGDDFLRDFRVDAANAFANGRLDCGLDSWIVASTHPDEITYGSEDAAGSSISGSAHVTNLTASTDFSIGQCVPSAAGLRRELTARVRLAASQGVTVTLSGTCEYFAQAACGGVSLGVTQEVMPLADTAGQWIGLVSRATAPASSVSAMCGYSLATAGESFDAFLDDLVLRDVCTGDDTDGDGVADECDVCPGFDDRADTDGDHVPDGCDVCQGEDSTGDSDGDGVCDDRDLCLGDDDTLDSDGDGFCNDLDACPGFDDGVDSDGDGVPNGCDQCQGYDAAGDSDGDGICDDVDLCRINDAAGDTDGDGVCDDVDVCLGFDDDADGDADGTPDGCDRCSGFDDRVDTDGDGMPDGCDLCQGTDAAGDGDGDGVCADRDCDDTDPSAAIIDHCGICGGDDSTCAAIFEDGFESGDTSAWSGAFSG